MGDYFNSSALPYNLPRDTQGQINKLAEIIDIPKTLVAQGGETELKALCGVILYRHLTPTQRHEVMRLVHSLDRRALIGRLVGKALDAHVNPHWGLWSMTNEELLKLKSHREDINSIASKLGYTASGLGAKALLKDVFVRGRLGKGHIVTLVIWGAVYANSAGLQSTKAELAQRTTLNESSYFDN